MCFSNVSSYWIPPHLFSPFREVGRVGWNEITLLSPRLRRTIAKQWRVTCSRVVAPGPSCTFTLRRTLVWISRRRLHSCDSLIGFYLSPFLRPNQTSLCVVGAMNINDLLEMHLCAYFHSLRKHQQPSQGRRGWCPPTLPLQTHKCHSVVPITHKAILRRGEEQTNARCLAAQIRPHWCNLSWFLSQRESGQWFQAWNIALICF